MARHASAPDPVPEGIPEVRPCAGQGDGGKGHAAAGHRPGRPGIKDVAAVAGVSYQTVSRVINGHPSVKHSTRELVRAAIRDLGFRPNPAAQALAGKPARSLTVVTPDTSLFGPHAAAQGIALAARLARFSAGLQVVESLPGSVPEEIIDATARSAEAGGAVIAIAWDEATIRALAAVPPESPVAAMIEAPPGGADSGAARVWIDDRKAAREATRYLLSLSHATVHYLSIPHWAGVSPRQAGWRSALETAGAPVPDPVQCGWTARSGYTAGRRLAADPDVTAVLCGNDDVAAGAMRAMREAGRAVPQDVSIIGFDDTGVSGYLAPSLTTVHLDFTGLALSCFALLQAQLDPGTSAPPPEQHPPRLVLRESTGPAR